MSNSISGDGTGRELQNPAKRAVDEHNLLEVQRAPVRDDSNRKLFALKNLLLKKGDEEREAILDSARREAAAWLQEQNEGLDRMLEQIHADAVKNAEEIAKRQVARAESMRAKDRLRLQNTLLDEAMGMMQSALTSLREREDYPLILAGLVLEAAKELPAGTSALISLAVEDAPLGEALAERAGKKRPDLMFTFDPSPVPITGGVWISAPDGSWRASASLRDVAAELKDSLAERLFATL
jgi:V/A-type H+-transporting ATPase subunit E